jgi:methionine sulfoxide reductase heme-binding subunit
VLHTLGAGTDASTVWLQAVLLLTGAPILFLALLRWLPDGAPAPQPRPEPAPPARPARPAEART